MKLSLTNIQPTPPEIIPNVVPKPANFFIDHGEFDSFKKPEPMAINVGQPKDENYDDLVMMMIKLKFQSH